MNRLFILFLLFIPSLILAQDTDEKPSPRTYSEDAGKLLASVPLQNAGRPKPFDSFARFNLLACYHESKMGKVSASDWLAQLLLDPETAYHVKCFRIKNEDLLADLGLEKSPDGKHVFSFNDLRNIIDSQRERVIAISKRAKAAPPQEPSLIESQLLKLSGAVSRYFTISRSFTCLTPQIEIKNAQLAKELGLPHNQAISYFQIYQQWSKLRALMEQLDKKYDRSNPYHNALFNLAVRLRDMQQREGSAASLTLVPHDKDQIHEEWLTTWQVMAPGSETSEKNNAYLAELHATVTAILANDDSAAEGHITKLRSFSTEKIQSITKVELLYNKFDAFTNSVAFYLLGFVLLGLSWLFAGKQLRWASWGSVCIGLLLHTIGILMRMYIRGRPAPVTNIYESVIFVGFVCVLLGVIIEFKRRDGLGLIIAIIPGAILHFVGFKYALDGDTMGRLVAVLDSNFWLSTHVVTITIGYGTAAIAGLIATSYLYVRLFNPNNKPLLQSISKNFIGVTLLALLFSIVGTILGGIWGDDSWGRFWGWDPKENGALLICLWLLIVMHGKWGKQLKELGVATMLSLTNISVLLAWFGVNLLSVGLHNYGFTDGAARNLTIACSAIFILTIIPSIIIVIRDTAQKSSAR